MEPRRCKYLALTPEAVLDVLSGKFELTLPEQLAGGVPLALAIDVVLECILIKMYNPEWPVVSPGMEPKKYYSIGESPTYKDILETLIRHEWLLKKTPDGGFAVCNAVGTVYGTGGTIIDAVQRALFAFAACSQNQVERSATAPEAQGETASASESSGADLQERKPE